MGKNVMCIFQKNKNCQFISQFLFMMLYLHINELHKLIYYEQYLSSQKFSSKQAIFI